MRFRMALSLTAMAPLLAASACPKEVSNVPHVWGETVSYLGIIPFYPMREDVYVGDVLLANDACASKNQRLPLTMLLGSIPPKIIKQKVEAFYGPRPELPKTVIAKAESKDGSTAANPPAKPPANPQATASQTEVFPDSQTRFERLRSVAFPALAMGSVAVGSFGVTLPVGGGQGRTAGFSGSDESHVNVSASGVEELQIPAPVMLTMIQDFLKTQEAKSIFDRSNIEELRKLMKRELKGVKNCDNQDANVSVVFVNRVFYARSIDFNFGNSSSIALSLAGALAKSEELTRKPSLMGANGKGQSEEEEKEALKELTGMLSGLNTFLASQTPGITASLGVGQFGGVTLKQTFDRPLALGASFALNYDPDCLMEVVEGKTDACGKGRAILSESPTGPLLLPPAAQ